MSKRRKLRFSVRRAPLSTRPFPRRSRTCFSWKPILRTFHVSPGKQGEVSRCCVGGEAQAPVAK